MLGLKGNQTGYCKESLTTENLDAWSDIRDFLVRDLARVQLVSKFHDVEVQPSQPTLFQSKRTTAMLHVIDNRIADVQPRRCGFGTIIAQFFFKKKQCP